MQRIEKDWGYSWLPFDSTIDYLDWVSQALTLLESSGCLDEAQEDMVLLRDIYYTLSPEILAGDPGGRVFYAFLKGNEPDDQDVEILIQALLAQEVVMPHALIYLSEVKQRMDKYSEWEFLTTPQLCEILQLNPKVIYRMRDQGKLGVFFQEGGTYRYHRISLWKSIVALVKRSMEGTESLVEIDCDDEGSLVVREKDPDR